MRHADDNGRQITGYRIRSTDYQVRDGKLVKVHRMDASKRKRVHAQAKRELKAWDAAAKKKG